MDTETVKEYILTQHIEQLQALGKFREEWIKGHAEVVLKVEEINRHLVQQNGSIASLQKWQGDHPVVCEARSLVLPAMQIELESVKTKLATNITAENTRREEARKWEVRFAPLVKIIGILALGALVAHPELFRAILK